MAKMSRLPVSPPHSNLECHLESCSLWLVVVALIGLLLSLKVSVLTRSHSVLRALSLSVFAKSVDPGAGFE